MSLRGERMLEDGGEEERVGMCVWERDECCEFDIKMGMKWEGSEGSNNRMIEGEWELNKYKSEVI